MPRGPGSPIQSLGDVTEWNSSQIREAVESDLGLLADRMESLWSDFGAAADGLAGDPLLRFHAGMTVPASTVFAALTGEVYLHGYDIARAARSPWTIPVNDALAWTHGMFPAMPSLVDPAVVDNLTATVELRLRGPRRERWRFCLRDGALTIGPPDGERVDWKVSAEPVAYMLLGYGRISPGRAVMSGKVLAWGRDPRVGARFSKLFVAI